MLTAGFTETESSESADIIIINTCGFINDARVESINEIMEAAMLAENSHSDGFRKRVAVMGCLSERYKDELKKELHEADYITGIPDESFVEKMCADFGIQPTSKPAEGWTPLTAGLPYSYIKISEGCSNNCTYCAIPLIRGPQQSYSPDYIMSHALSAVKNGARELIVVGQDTASYRHGNLALPDIVSMMSGISGVDWIRIMYMHPDHITDAIIGAIAENPKVVKYIDLPFQHASPRILSAMGRRGSAEIYLELLAKIRAGIDRVKIRSTFMIGFPGETADDYNELAVFIKEAQLDRAGLFIYSEEEGTPAFLMKDSVPMKTRRSRYNSLMKVLKKISIQKLEQMIGSELLVLVEERIDDTTFLCRTEFDAPEVDGIFILTAEDAVVNSIVNARVTGSSEYDLYGVPL